MIEKSVHLLKNARGHLFLFPNNFSVFKYFHRASSEKKSPWASFSIPKHFFSIQIFLQGIFRKKEPVGIFWRKEPMGIFFYSQIFFSIQIFLQGIFRKKEPVGIFRKKSPWASLEEKSPWASFSIPKYFLVFKYFYSASSEKKSPWASFSIAKKLKKH